MWQWILGFYAVMSLVTYVIYAWDKAAAAQGRWRVRERSMLLCEFLGGWPGAACARKIMRHKTRKTSYLVWSWIIIFAHVAFWGWWWMKRETM